MVKDWGFGEGKWHIEIRDLTKHELVNLLEIIRVKCGLSDNDMNELVTILKKPLDNWISE